MQQWKVVLIYKFLPWFLGEIKQLVLDLRSKFQLILVDVLKHILSSDDLCNFDKLIIIISSFEERFSLEHHTGQDAASTPNIKLIIVVGHSNQQLRPFEVSASHSAVELLLGSVKIGQAPISDSHLFLSVID